MRIKQVKRTAAVAWSPGSHQPHLALGSVSGALDASFSSSTELEIFDLSGKGSSLNKLASVPVNARFNRLSWGKSSGMGLIAGGKENGELDLWSPSHLLANNVKEAMVFRGTKHGGPVRGLDFNTLSPNLLLTGATEGELLIWDLNNLSKPFSPGAKSQRMDDITVVSWNKHADYILAAGSTNGSIVLWDTRSRRELIRLSNPGGRKPITGFAWHPDAPTELISVADDDLNPVVNIWNLKNASAPERVLYGHSKGIMAVDWCPKDYGLLLTSGKDNRTIVWDVDQGIPIGDLAVSSNWTFDCKWYPRNPDLSFTASYDGYVTVHSLLSNSDHVDDPLSPQLDASTHNLAEDDPFRQIGMQQRKDETIQPNFTLPHPPKWFRRPCGASFAFGSQLVKFNTESTCVSIEHVPTVGSTLTQQLNLLGATLSSHDHSGLAGYAHQIATDKTLSPKDKEIWSFLAALFAENSRDEMVGVLGVDRSKIAEERLEGLFKKLNVHVDAPVEEADPTPFSLFSTGKSSEESDIDSLITKAVLFGDFETAVKICLNSNRHADALALACNGGEELLYKTQKAYFDKTVKTKSYARVLQSILNGDLHDLVEHARLDGPASGHWKDLFAMICTYSTQEDYSRLLLLLGQRLDAFKANKSDIKDTLEKQHSASLCFAAAGAFYPAAEAWIHRAQQEENVTKRTSKSIGDISMAHALITHRVVNLVTVLRYAIGFVDHDLEKVAPPPLDEFGQSTEPLEFPLGTLYDRYIDYATLLADSGNLAVAWTFLEQIPEAYISTLEDESRKTKIALLKDRVYQGGGSVAAIVGPPPLPFEVHPVQDEYVEPPAPVYQAPTQKLGGYQGYGHSAQPSYSQPAQWTPPAQVSNAPYTPSSQYQGGQGNQYGYQNAPTNSFQPPVNQVNQFQPPVNQFQPPVNQINQFQPPVNQFQPPVNQFQPPVNQFQPPVNQSWQAPQPAVNPYAPVVPLTRDASFAQPQQSYAAPPASTQTPIVPESNLHRTSNLNLAVGDRSHIPPKQKACFDGLTSQLKHLQELTNTPVNKKLYEDSEKRVHQLFDEMNNGLVGQDIADRLLQIVHFLEKNDIENARKVQSDLLTKRFDVTGHWIMGIRRLIDTLEKAAMGTLNPTTPDRRLSGAAPSLQGQGLPGPPMQASAPPPRPATFAPPAQLPGFQPMSNTGPGMRPPMPNMPGTPSMRPPQFTGPPPTQPTQFAGPPPSQFARPPGSQGQPQFNQGPHTGMAQPQFNQGQPQFNQGPPPAQGQPQFTQQGLPGQGQFNGSPGQGGQAFQTPPAQFSQGQGPQGGSSSGPYQNAPPPRPSSFGPPPARPMNPMQQVRPSPAPFRPNTRPPY